jgi:transposase
MVVIHDETTWRSAMKNVGMDLGKKQSDVCVIDEHGEVVERYRIRTNKKALSGRFINVPRCKIAIEACRDSGWVSRHLKKLGHTVVVVDTTRARSVGIGHGRRKTDRRDAEALARALHAGVVPRAHVLSKKAQRLRDVLQTRHQLVSYRAQIVTMLRGQLQAEGIVVAPCETAKFAQNLRASGLEQVQRSHVRSMLAVLGEINVQIASLEIQLKGLAKQHEAYERLCSVTGVALVVCLSFIAALDDPRRFNNAHQVQAYLGLVPSEYTTGGKRRLGRVTRCGNGMARRMLVQAAHSMMRSKRRQEDPLVLWARQVEKRRGKKKAAMALARRLAGVLWAMWIDGTFYDPQGLARESFGGLTRRQRLAAADAQAMKSVQQVAPAV